MTNKYYLAEDGRPLVYKDGEFMVTSFLNATLFDSIGDAMVAIPNDPERTEIKTVLQFADGSRVYELPQPEQSGDWHDRPLRWAAVEPNADANLGIQKFSTRREACSYRTIRSKSSTAQEATRQWIAASPTAQTIELSRCRSLFS